MNPFKMADMKDLRIPGYRLQKKSFTRTVGSASLQFCDSFSSQLFALPPWPLPTPRDRPKGSDPSALFPTVRRQTPRLRESFFVKANTKLRQPLGYFSHVELPPPPWIAEFALISVESRRFGDQNLLRACLLASSSQTQKNK